jgi:hypothetical protein
MSILLVLAAALVGSLAGQAAVPHLRRYKGTGLLAALIPAAAISAAATNATQTLLDLEVPFTAVDIFEAASYFVFGFSAMAASLLLKPSRLRWWLVLLVPIALFEPLRLTFAFIRWSMR